MPRCPLLRQGALLLILLLTVGLAHWPTLRQAAAFDSPLPTPWPTLVVTYSPALPTTTPTLAPTATAVGVTFVLHSPLPTPTTPPDFSPPQSTLLLTGTQSTSGWYRSPVTLTFAITDNLGAGVTQYQLDAAAGWTDREYYYPPVVLTDDGIHDLRYHAIDRAHNTEATQATQIRIDRTPPQTDEPLITGNQLPNGWYNTGVTVTLHGSDALAGLAGFELAQAAAGWTTSAATTVITATTQQTLTWRAVDQAGNVSPAQELTLLVDLTPPTTTHTIAPLPAGGWYSTPVTITLTAVDEGAGLFQTDYRIDNAASWQRYAAPFTLSSDGLHTVHYQSSDRALNREAIHTVTLALDRTPPTISAAVDGQLLAPGWYRADATVVATATDSLAGLVAFDYQTNHGVWQPYRAPLAMPTGQQALHLRARDQAGNAATTTLTLGIDTQPPTTTLQLTPRPNAAGWHNQPVTVTLVATDTGSGLFQRQIQWPGQPSPAIYLQPRPWAHEGISTLTWFSVDRALNQEAPQTTTLALDWTPPLITYTVTGDAVAPGWYRSAAQVTVTATDAVAGLGALAYRLADGAWQPYTKPLTIADGGQHLVHLRAVDQADNLAEVTTIPIGIDTLPPQSTVLLSGTRAPNGWYVTPVTVTLTTTDTGAGVAAVQWRLNGGLWQPYTAPFVVTSERVNLLEYQATDHAGNQAALAYTVFSIDLVDPTTRLGLVQGISGDNGWYVSPLTLTLSAQDLESGLQVIEYRVNDQPWQPYTRSVTIRAEGSYQIHYRAVDSSGRLDATRTLTVHLDLSAPLITGTLPTTVTYGNLALTPFYTVTDTVSGVLTSTLLLDGAPYAPDQPLTLGSHLVEINAVNGAGLITRRTQSFVVVGGRFYLPLIGR